MTRGDQPREKRPDYADVTKGTGQGDNPATLGGEPTVEGAAPDGGDIASGTAAGGTKKGPMTSGPSDPGNIAGREGEFDEGTSNEGLEHAGSRS